MTGPLAYIGGKRRVATQIAALIPSHRTYVEPFAGGAQVFFHKPPSDVEVLNDLDGEIVNFFRVCQNHADELVRWLQFSIVSRRMYQLYARQEPTDLTDIQRAARFLYLQKSTFGARVRRQTYHYCVVKRPNFNPGRLDKLLHDTADRLQHVQLECWPYEKVLERYDRPTTFFYLDPPYVDRQLYRFNFTHDDFAQLAERLKPLRGKFLLSINDCDLSRHLFGQFHCRTLPVIYTAARGVPTVQELIISNYELPA